MLVAAVLGGGVYLLTKDDDPVTKPVSTTVAPVDTSGPVSTETAASSLPPTGESIASDAMLTVLRRITAESGVTATESVNLDGCPAGDLRQMAAAGPAVVQSIAGSAEDPSSWVFQPDIVGEFPLVNCAMDSSDFASGIGIGMGEAIDDFENDLSIVLPEFIVTIEASTPHLGGTIVRFCADPIGVDGDLRPFCEADWYDDNVWLGVFIGGDDRSSALAEEWLIAVLPDAANQVANA